MLHDVEFVQELSNAKIFSQGPVELFEMKTSTDTSMFPLAQPTALAPTEKLAFPGTLLMNALIEPGCTAYAGTGHRMESKTSRTEPVIVPLVP